MADSSVCIAGIDLSSGDNVRLSEPQPTLAFTRLGPGIHPYDVIDLDYTFVRGRGAPHLEDAVWLPRSLKRRAAMSIDDIRRTLSATAFASIISAFDEPNMRASNDNHGWAPGSGMRSLATIRVGELQMHVDASMRLRLSLRDAAGSRWEGVPFQDLSVRVHESGCDACRSAYVASVRAEFRIGAGLIRVGLTRPFAQEGAEPLCWLQVTNIIVPRAHF